MSFPVKVVQRPAVPERPAADAEFRALGIQRQGVCRISLQLDGVGAGGLGLADQADSPLEILTVVAGHPGPMRRSWMQMLEAITVLCASRSGWPHGRGLRFLPLCKNRHA